MSAHAGLDLTTKEYREERMRNLLLALILGCSGVALAQSQGSMPGMDMSGQDAPKHDSIMQDRNMKDMPGMAAGNADAMQSMEGHMDMGPHMKMTALRDPKPGDKEKADQVAKAARAVADKYQDYKVALADGYQIFHPEVPQKMYHFTNYSNAFQAWMEFDPWRPTSLLYEKHGDGYKLIGVMYTAKKGTSEDELNERIPLSIAQWHAHVNLCLPPPDKKQEAIPPNAKYGLRGSITTKEDCEAAGGKFMPQIFGWMVHVYPYEQKPEDVWSVERQQVD
jgi:hypothetical protein